jgi:hypothetical protein
MCTNKYIIPTQALLLTTLILSGCNDDNSSSDSSTDSTPEKDSQITAENAKPLAAAAFASVDTVQGLPVSGGTVRSRSGDTASGNFNYSDFIVNKIAGIQEDSLLMGRGVASASAVTAYKALTCTIQVTGDIADTQQLAAGDTASFSFSECNYDTTLLVDGTIGITLTEISEDFNGTAPYTVGIVAALTDFKVQNEGSVFTSNGDITMLVSEDESGNKSAQMSGSSIRVFKDSFLNIASVDLNEYLVDITENSAGEYSVSMEGSVDVNIPFVNVGADFSTVTPFTGTNLVSESDNPTGGELHLSNGISQAWVIIQPDGVNIQIDLDIDGDNVVDETLMTSWTELQNIF